VILYFNIGRIGTLLAKRSFEISVDKAPRNMGERRSGNGLVDPERRKI
jgi:hypothetical protein